MSQLGVVAIGRNEGTRLERCLSSVQRSASPGVYVDSGSTDDSLAVAEAARMLVVQLDSGQRFTAARARHAGFERLVGSYPSLPFVMFVDGDCEIVDDWVPRARQFLDDHPQVAVVFGRNRECHPERSVYNRLCDLEWNSDVGRALSCGGNFVIRSDVYRQVGGFNPTVAAGEEPELCHRVRQAGHAIWRLDAEMTRHDADMTRFGQWWLRQVRTGYGGLDVERRFHTGVFRQILRSAVFWGGFYPLATVGVVLFAWGRWGWPAAAVLFLAAAGLWGIQVARVARRYQRNGLPWTLAARCALFTMVSKMPTAVGMAACLRESWQGRLPRLIEYKS